MDRSESRLWELIERENSASSKQVTANRKWAVFFFYQAHFTFYKRSFRRASDRKCDVIVFTIRHTIKKTADEKKKAEEIERRLQIHDTCVYNIYNNRRQFIGTRIRY